MCVCVFLNITRIGFTESPTPCIPQPTSLSLKLISAWLIDWLIDWLILFIHNFNIFLKNSSCELLLPKDQKYIRPWSYVLLPRTAQRRNWKVMTVWSDHEQLNLLKLISLNWLLTLYYQELPQRWKSLFISWHFNDVGHDLGTFNYVNLFHQILN